MAVFVILIHFGLFPLIHSCDALLTRATPANSQDACVFELSHAPWSALSGPVALVTGTCACLFSLKNK